MLDLLFLLAIVVVVVGSLVGLGFYAVTLSHARDMARLTNQRASDQEKYLLVNRRLDLAELPPGQTKIIQEIIDER